MLVKKIIHRFSNKNFRNLIKEKKKIQAQKIIIEIAKNNQNISYKQPSQQTKKILSFFYLSQFIPPVYCICKNLLSEIKLDQYYYNLNIINYWVGGLILLNNSYRLYFGYKNKERTSKHRKLFVLTTAVLVSTNLIMMDNYLIKSACGLTLNLINLTVEKKLDLQESEQYKQQEKQKVESQQSQIKLENLIVILRLTLNFLFIVQICLFIYKKKQQNQVNKMIEQYQKENLKDKLQNQRNQIKNSQQSN